MLLDVPGVEVMFTMVLLGVPGVGAMFTLVLLGVPVIGPCLYWCYLVFQGLDHVDAGVTRCSIGRAMFTLLLLDAPVVGAVFILVLLDALRNYRIFRQ